MSDSPVLNPGLGPNEIVSPDNLHTEPPFVRPVYDQEPVVEPEVQPEVEPEAEPEVEPKAKKAKK